MILSVDEEPFASLWQYWNNVRGDRPMPGSYEVDFTQLAAILPEMSVLDIINPREMRYRLAGSNIVAGFGGELTGINPLDIFAESNRAALSRFLTVIITQPCAGLCRISIDYQSGWQSISNFLAVPVMTSGALAGRIVLVQHAEQPERDRLDDLISVIGSDLFCARLIDTGQGLPDHPDQTSAANGAAEALTFR